MSDISIPGITNRYNTDELVDKLMEVERIPLTRLEDRVSLFKDQKKVWVDVRQRLSNLQESAKSLYGFENPFQARTVESSESNILTATATREAEKEVKDITVEKIAEADRFLSRSLERDYKIPSGTYSFAIGDTMLRIPFKGGSIKQFVEILNKRGEGRINAATVNDTSETQILLIESLKTGAANTLTFHDDALPFALNTGILKETRGESYSFSLDPSSIRPWSKPVNEENFSLADGVLTLSPGGELSLPVTESIPVSEDLVLSFDVAIQEIDKELLEPALPPPGPDIPEGGEINFENIIIKNQRSDIELPKWTPPPTPETKEDLQAVFLQSRSGTIPTPPFAYKQRQTVEIRLSDYVDSLTAVDLRNANSHRILSFSDIRIYNPKSRGDYLPLNPISQASDAQISLNGIKVTRDSNTIDDLIPGITLNLHKPSVEPVTLSVESDKKSIKESIITFIGHYNRLLAEIHILTSNDDGVIEEIEYFTEDDKEKAYERLGLFQGDITLMQLKNRLQRIMMDPYETSYGRELSLLAQIGISTKVRGFGFDNTRLRGYLEIDEEKLDGAIESKHEGIQELFGKDSDGDLIIDTGVAYAADTNVSAYVRNGGIISVTVQNLDSQIARSNRDIENYTARLERKEQELREKYSLMEGALENLEQTSQALDNFQTSNSKNQ